jgi:IS605 OrfB family transposase
MSQVSTTLKIKFLDLNQSKADLFAQMTVECTELANELLKLELPERRKMTTAKVVTSLMSAVANQVIRHTTSGRGKKTKQYKLLPPEINKQNWEVFKVGETYSISFPTIKEFKRIPLVVEGKHSSPILDRLLAKDPTIDKGTVKIIKHRRKWYAFISITQEVPSVESSNLIGVDRGQNNLAVVAGSLGFGKFFKGREIKYRRRRFQLRRKKLQKAGKYRAVKKSKKKESKWMNAVNHTVSRRIVASAEFKNADVVLEDLEGCRQTMKHWKENRANNGESRHTWAFYDLEQKIAYKMQLIGRRIHKVPAPYTSKSCSTCGTIGRRHGHDFNCPHGHYRQQLSKTAL